MSESSKPKRERHTITRQNAKPHITATKDGKTNQNQQKQSDVMSNQQNTSDGTRKVRFLFDQTKIIPGNRQKTLERVVMATSQLDQSQKKENPSMGI